MSGAVPPRLSTSACVSKHKTPPRLNPDSHTGCAADSAIRPNPRLGLPVESCPQSHDPAAGRTAPRTGDEDDERTHERPALSGQAAADDGPWHDPGDQRALPDLPLADSGLSCDMQDGSCVIDRRDRRDRRSRRPGRRPRLQRHQRHASERHHHRSRQCAEPGQQFLCAHHHKRQRRQWRQRRQCGNPFPYTEQNFGGDGMPGQDGGSINATIGNTTSGVAYIGRTGLRPTPSHRLGRRQGRRRRGADRGGGRSGRGRPAMAGTARTSWRRSGAPGPRRRATGFMPHRSGARAARAKGRTSPWPRTARPAVRAAMPAMSRPPSTVT